MAIAKVTKRENFMAIITVLEEQGLDNLVAVMKHEIELLDKKHGSVSKADKAKAEANEALKADILNLIKGTPMTASDIAQSLSTADNLIPNQKITAMLRQLGESVTREVVKGKAYFSA